MSEHIKLAENIILIDVSGLNETLINLVRFFEGSIGRKLKNVDLETWIIDLALDAGLREGEHRTQILFVYDDSASYLEHCTTRELKSVDGWGCRNQFGEFIFSAISSEGLASPESVFFDLLQITLNSEDVKRLILLPADNEYGVRLHELLEDTGHLTSPDANKDIIRFFPAKTSSSSRYRSEVLIFSLMHALGVRSEDLDLIR